MRTEILLVIPPAPYLISDRVFPPLGILYVASYLEKAGRTVKVCDLTGVKNWGEAFAKELRKSSPAYIGVTATTPDMPVACGLLKISRRVAPCAIVVIGGPHATIDPGGCADFDRIVPGDGFKASLTAFSKRPGKLIKTPLLKDLDRVPFPARHLIDMRRYAYYLGSKPAASIMSRLGCPFKCAFCSGRRTDFYTKIRFRSPENVLEEMDLLNERYGYGAFVFYDDEFNLDRKHVLKMCALLSRRDYAWRAPVRTDLLDLELALAMKRSGCVEVTAGVESGSDKVLKRCGKGTTAAINSTAREICRTAGIRFKAFVVVGLPGSGEADEKLTERWLIENKPDGIDITVNTPYPSTPEFHERKKYGLEFDYDPLKHPVSYKFAPAKYRSFCSNGYMSAARITRVRETMDRDVRRALGLPRPGY